MHVIDLGDLQLSPEDFEQAAAWSNQAGDDWLDHKHNDDHVSTFNQGEHKHADHQEIPAGPWPDSAGGDEDPDERFYDAVDPDEDSDEDPDEQFYDAVEPAQE